LSEAPDENTEMKIESIRSNKPMEKTVEFERAISPSPILIEPNDDSPKAFDKTIVHDFDYTPTDVERENVFNQGSEVKNLERKLFKPIDHPMADPMPIAH
jgi:hypothetical protein